LPGPRRTEAPGCKHPGAGGAIGYGDRAGREGLLQGPGYFKGKIRIQHRQPSSGCGAGCRPHPGGITVVFNHAGIACIAGGEHRCTP